MERAATYTHGHAESVLRSHRWRTVENSAAYLLPYLVPGASVVDVGCGPGTITIDIARHVGPGLVQGIDASADVIAAAGATAVDDQVANVAFTTGDLYALDLPDDSVDVVHAHQVLQHVAHPVAALREMRRVCKPTGVLAARDAVYRAMSWYPVSAGLDRWLEVYCHVAEANRGEPDAGSRLRSWAIEAGCSEVTASASAWCYATPGERAWWGGLWADRIAGTALGARAVELGIAEPSELPQLAQAWRSWADADGAWFAVLHGEILATP